MTPSVPETLAALEHEQWAHWTKHPVNVGRRDA